MKVEKQQLQPDKKQWTASNSGKECVKALYCRSAYLTSMQSTSCEKSGWMKHKLKSRMMGEIPVTSGMQMTLPLWLKAKRT